MKFLFKYLLVCCFVAVSVVSSSQPGGLYHPELNQSSNNLYSKITGEIYYLNSESNKYFFLHDKWVKGAVTYRSGEIFSDIELRYNAFKDELVAYNKNIKVLVKIDKEKVKDFVLDLKEAGISNRNMFFVNIDSVNITINTNYFECLYQGNVMLLISNRIVENKVNPYRDITGRYRDTEYVIRRLNFIYSKQTGLTRIRFSNKAVAKVYPEYKREILKILRNHKIKIHDSDSAILAFELLDSENLLK